MIVSEKEIKLDDRKIFNHMLALALSKINGVDELSITLKNVSDLNTYMYMDYLCNFDIEGVENQDFERLYYWFQTDNLHVIAMRIWGGDLTYNPLEKCMNWKNISGNIDIVFNPSGGVVNEAQQIISYQKWKELQVFR